jgi:hypothetical protein
MAIITPLKKIFNWQLASQKITTPEYKVYIALLTQGGTTAPTAVELQNTLGDVTWHYDGPGGYHAELNGGNFPETTYMLIGPPTWDGGNFYFIGGTDVGGSSLFLGSIYIPTGVPSNGAMFNTTIEIRVYN